FSYALVVHTAAAAANPHLSTVELAIAADGLAVSQSPDGAVVATDANGEVAFSAAGAYMWDSSTPPDPGGAPLVEEDGSGDAEDVPPAQFTAMPLELAGGTLTIEPDQALLADPATEFPVVIDPPFSGKRMAWATVHQQQPSRGWTDDSRWPRQGGMRVGNLQWWPGFPCGDACGLWRSAIRFNIRGLAGKQIVSASVKAVQSHTSGCGSYGLQLWYVTAFTSGTSWNGLSDKWQDLLQTQAIDSSNRSGGCTGTQPHGVTYSSSAVRSRVQAHADAGHASLSFGFQSSDEVAKQAYRRIAVNSVKLEVVYNRPAQTPTGLSTDGMGCTTSAPGVWLTTARPTLSGKPRDPDGRTGAHLEIHRIGSSKPYYSWKSAVNRATGKVVNHRLPASRALPSGAYRWRMRSLDNQPGAVPSAWVGWCYFRVDVTAPTTPKVEIVGEPPAAGEQVTLRLTSSDAHSGLAGFSYGINEEVKRKSLASSGTATITFTAASSGGRNFVYVWSRDKAGNVSNRAVFDFFAARLVEATPVAAWRLDGDGLDDSGHGHELLLGNGVSWAAGGSAPGDRSLALDGTGCVATDGPVVRTDAEYTVAARVRLDDLTVDHTVMTQAGKAQSGFYLKYKSATGKWRMTLASKDSREVTWATLEPASATAQAGVWTHLAVRVDPAARHMQMYINGVLAGERDIPFIPWHATGSLHLGCESRIVGETWFFYKGAIQHAGVWQGLLTPTQVTATRNGELPAGLTGDWRLRADGTDASAHARPLTLPTSGVTWVDDQYGRLRSAMRLNGTGGAESTGPIVRTDQSFSVAAWARLDDKLGNRAVISQTGSVRSSFFFRYHLGRDRWEFAMPSADALTVTWSTASSQQAPQVGQWYHLVGVFDRAAKTLRLYVDGQLQSTVAGPITPWRSDGEFLVGWSGEGPGGADDEMVGTISDVKSWRGALNDQQAVAVYGGNPAVAQLSRWNLDGQGADLVGGRHLTVEGVEGVDYDWVEDRTCRPFRALGLQVSGGGFARTGGPVVVTDESYTITAWVKLEQLTGGYQTVLAQRGGGRAAMYLQVTPTGSWRLSMPQQEFGTTTWAGAESAAGVAEAEAWTHLAGVFDLAAGEARLFVDGELVAVGEAVDSPWHADGPFYIGTGGIQDGLPYQPSHASIDEVSAWSSTLDPDRILDMGSLSPDVPCL
ncbi:MAG: LamG domain-containing protein, partial [Natronosporangium sp.]